MAARAAFAAMVERRPTLGILAHVVLLLGVLVVALPVYITFVASTHTAERDRAVADADAARLAHDRRTTPQALARHGQRARARPRRSAG